MAQTRHADWWPRLDAAFQGALDCQTAERAAYLERACGADAALRAEVEAMLAADGPQCSLGLERLVADATAADAPDPIVGLRLGPWRVVDVLGHGGMGTVYRAERDDGRYRQQVALKLVRGASHRPGASRFAAEAAILARLSHPNIARVIDAGHTPEGSAYLVMECVDGAPITAHADARRLTVEERLRLFRVVCDATGHAHHALVVHLDLKPANILVSAAGQVKLLDFGIAKLLEPDRPPAEPTAPGLRALTPGYAAPEQIRGEPLTTAADVYVLGAVLYELLTGQRAARQEPDAGPSVEQPRLPPPPSAAVARVPARAVTGAVTAASIAAARRTSPGRLARRLVGDIDRVVLKALQPEPGRRYRSAIELGDDVQRILDGRPVLAQPDARLYRLRRFVGRHRLATSMAAALGVMIAAFAVVAGLQARSIAVERDRARVEARRAERVSVLVTGLFELAEPGPGRGDTITARQLLDRGAHRIAVELQGEPETQVALFNAIARVYGNLGLHDAAIAVLDRAIDRAGAAGAGTLAGAEAVHLLAERLASKDDHARAEGRFRAALASRRRLQAPGRDIAATLEGLGRTLNAAGRYAEARGMLEDALVIRRREPGASDAELMSGLHELGLLVHFAGDTARAEQLFREAAAVSDRMAGPSTAKVAGLQHKAELVAVFDRQPARAEPLLREALRMARTIHAGDHANVATSLAALAGNLHRLRKLPDAEAVARESAAMAQRLHGVRHEETLAARLTLARILRAAQKPQEAEGLLRDSLPHARALLGDGDSTTIVIARGLATVLEEQRRFHEALATRREELARTARVLGDHDVFVATGLAELGQHGLLRGRLDLAEQYYQQALAVRERLHPKGHWRIDEARGQLGVARLRAGRLAEAETDLLAAHDGLRAHRGATAKETLAARMRLAELYEQWRKPSRARLYRDATP